MTRKTAFRIAMIATPVVAFVLYAALNWYVLEDRKERVGLSEAAERDPHLAFTRLLARMGTRVEVARSPTRLATPPEGGVLMLGTRRLAFMTSERLAALEAWVERGGTLVALAEPPGINDPLLERYGFEREVPEVRRGGRKVGPGESREGGKRNAKRRPEESIATIRWPDAPKGLRVQQNGLGLVITRETDPPEMITGTAHGRLMLAMFPSGRGRVVFGADFRFLGNEQIGKLDHAEFAWRLASGAPDNKAVMLFLRSESPSLWDWMIEHAWPALAVVAVLLLVWLSRIVPRFGPLEPDAPPARRSLLEHLRAGGRYAWSRNAATPLIDAVRDRVWRTALRRRAGLRSMAHSQAQATLAETAGQPVATVQRAMQGVTNNPAAFIATAAALQQIEAGLAHRSRNPNRSRKEKQK